MIIGNVVERVFLFMCILFMFIFMLSKTFDQIQNNQSSSAETSVNARSTTVGIRLPKH